MATPAAVTPNRRGVKSRELVLDAAERVMASHGFDAATVARVVEESGVPLSSVYHYYGSKEGILLAVMERGAQRFFDELPEPDRRLGRPAEHLASVLTAAVENLERHPDFLRLMVVFAAQPPAASTGEVQAVVGRVRELALERLRRQIALAFRDDPASPCTDSLARFALAAIDGAFIAAQADHSLKLEQLLGPLAPALVAARHAL
jgi:AcrR family transcriptional regulator